MTANPETLTILGITAPGGSSMGWTATDPDSGWTVGVSRTVQFGQTFFWGHVIRDGHGFAKGPYARNPGVAVELLHTTIRDLAARLPT